MRFDQKFEGIETSPQIAESHDRNSTIPLYSFTEKLETFSRDLGDTQQNLLSLFSNMPTNKQWLKVSSVDFATLMKVI